MYVGIQVGEDRTESSPRKLRSFLGGGEEQEFDQRQLKRQAQLAVAWRRRRPALEEEEESSLIILKR